jgi:hypothetical protein
MMAIMSTPAAADCYLFKVIIGTQRAIDDEAHRFPARYDLRAKTFEVDEAQKRTGDLHAYCEFNVVIIQEQKPPSNPGASTPSGAAPSGGPTASSSTAAPAGAAPPKGSAPATEGEGMCWLDINSNTVKGQCFRPNAKPVIMEGTIY